MRYDLVIFDCDGVVVDSERIGNRVFRRFLADLGLSFSESQVYERFLGRALADSLKIIEELLGHPVPAELVHRYKQARDDTLRAEVEPIGGIRELLHDLDMPYCIASSGDHGKMRATLGATGLLPLFEGRIFSATDVPRAKPAPDVFLLAAASMHADPTRTAVVEDTVGGVTAACAAGMTAFGFAGLTPSARLIDAGAHATFGDMRELRALLGLRPAGDSTQLNSAR